VTVTVYIPLLVAPLFALIAPRASRRLPPAAATWLLSCGTFAVASATIASLALVAAPLVAQTPIFAREGSWSDAVLVAHDPVKTPVAVAAIAALVAIAGSFGRNLRRQVRALRSAHRLAAALPGRAQLAVLDTGQFAAYAVPGRPGRIVVSASTLRALDSRQRRALLAHERAHLAHRHHLHLAVVGLAAATDPLLRPVVAAARASCERWADERAVVATDRAAVAAALARAGALTTATTTLPALAMASCDVEFRVAALSRPAPRLAAWRLGVPLVLIAISGLALVNAAAELHTLLELAQRR
jgi:peptidoglycan hydrolase-like protein with peptidoglycan-binding domain